MNGSSIATQTQTIQGGAETLEPKREREGSRGEGKKWKVITNLWEGFR
jgi:hypothetical protein